MGGGPGVGGGPGAGGAGGCATSDLSTDPMHCGACFHDCLGGACKEGMCQPVAIGQAQTSSQDASFWIKVDDTNLFLASLLPDLSVSKMPKGGGALEMLMSAEHVSLVNLAMLGDSLYIFADVNNPGEPATEQLFRLSKSGGEPTVLQDDPHLWFLDLTPDGDSLLYFKPDFGAQTSAIKVMRYHPNDNSSDLVTVAPSQIIATSIAVDESFVYVWSMAEPVPPETQFTHGAIYRAPKLGGDAVLLVEGDRLYSVMPAGANLYYLLGDVQEPHRMHQLARMPKAGGSSSIVIDEDPAFNIRPLAFDEQELWYYRTQSDDSLGKIEIMKSPAPGGAGALVAADEVGWNFARDETCLYWVRPSGQVMRLVR